jgi:putative copper resistance protein D
VPALIGTAYGRLLLVKLALFMAMVALAAVNRWSLTPRLDRGNNGARRALRRNAILETAAGIAIVTVVGALGVTIPAAHQPAVWPFDHTLSWEPAQQSLGIRAALVAAGALACIAAGAILRGIRRHRASLWVAGLAGIVAAGSTCDWLLAVPAYPTTYLTSPVPYSVDSIVHGATLYRQDCGACHGAHGHSDGPQATSLSLRPVDLAEHALHHRAGNLFWWIAHGIPGTPMPGFAPQLSDMDVWDVVQFLRAQAQAARAVTLTNRVEPRHAIEVPDFSFEIAGQGQASLKQRRANEVTLLVFYTLPQSLPRLHELASAEPRFAAAGARVIAVPLGQSSTSAGAGTAGDLILATARPNAAAAYAMFARRPSDKGDVALEHAEFLIDAQGYLRARWIGDPAAQTDRTVEILREIKQLDDERPRAPPPEEHAH